MSGRKLIMILDDDSSIRFLLGRILNKNYDVLQKSNGWEAMEAMENGTLPDMILLDMQMPGLNGLAFLNNIRKSGLYRDIPVIVISGSVTEPTVRKCEEAGIVGFLNKPFNPAHLNALIESVLIPQRESVNA